MWRMAMSNPHITAQIANVLGHKRRGAPRTHGMSRTKEYQIWQHMRRRCASSHPDYGGRGIAVCERWQSFENFIRDMGFRPSVEHSLDRIDVAKGYGPDNCRWATRLEQARNKRTTKRIEFAGATWTLSELADIFDIDHTTLKNRIYNGWPVDKALLQPPKIKRQEGPDDRPEKSLLDEHRREDYESRYAHKTKRGIWKIAP